MELALKLPAFLHHDPGGQLRSGQVPGHLPFMGVSKKVETALGHGHGSYLRNGCGLRCELAHQRVFEQQGSGLYADRDLYLGHRLSGAVCGMFLQKAMPSLYEALACTCL